MIGENDNESIQSSIQTESDKQEINQIKNRMMRSNKPYYPRHSPPDQLFEEHHKYSSHMYSGNGIYEWNIDGRSEYEIMNLLQEMGMASIAFKATSTDITDKQACVMLLAGFTGALKFWWDNSLDPHTQNSIINHVETIQKEDEDGFIIETEKQNAVEVLIHTIMMHFIGNPAEELESKKIILTNLRCPTLGDFKWYKDVFITNIFQRHDCNQSFWKKRFIGGLPTFFAENVINKLKEISGGQPIPWNTITYGQLFAFVKKIGLSICQEQKDKKRNDKFKFRITMGSFCEQYGYEKFNPPSRSKRISHRSRKPSNMEYYKKRKIFNNYTKNNYSKNKKNNHATNKQRIVCWNCKRPGHRSTECKMKKKINEIFQDQPDIQEKLTKLLISKSESTENSDEEYSIDEIENSSESSIESQHSSDNLCNCKTINVITNDKDKQFLLDIIDKIYDPEIKKDYLIKLKYLINQETKISTPQPFSLNKIFEKYPTQSLFKQVSTYELQNEIKQIKTQIKDLH